VGTLVCSVGADDVQAQDVNLLLAIVIGIAGMGIVGAVLSAKAPQSPLGPAYQVAAMFAALAIFASLYGERGVTDLPDLPFVPIAGWLMQLGFLPTFGATLTVFLLFPDDHPPSPRWRPVAWLIWGGGFVAAIGTTFGVETFEFSEGVTVANPFQMGPEGLLTAANLLGGVAMFGGGLLTVISVVVRFRRSEGEERHACSCKSRSIVAIAAGSRWAICSARRSRTVSATSCCWAPSICSAGGPAGPGAGCLSSAAR
jgi:hypothetical protein